MTDQRRIRAVLFDWNGTLITDLPSAYRAWMACFTLLGVERMTLAEFRRRYSLPWQTFYRRYGVDARKLRRYGKRLDAIYSTTWCRGGIRLTPGAKSLIIRMRANGIKLGILSDDPHREIVKLLSRWGLRRHFSFIGTSERYPSKPSPAGITAFLRRCRCRPQEALFVGDLTADIGAGIAAGVTTVAYLNGWQTPMVLRRAKPDYTIKRLPEISRLLEKN